MKQPLPTLAALAVTLIPAFAMADKTVDTIAKPDLKAPITSWTPGQQWVTADDSKYGNGTEILGQMLLADELGSRLSELGRVRTIQRCLKHQAKQPEEGMLAWAVCRHDVSALDMKKLEAELATEGITGEAKTRAIEWVNDIVKTAKLTGDPIEALAKTEPGVQQIFKVADDARAEWAAYEAKNKASVDRYVALKDAVRSARGNDKAFTGCYEATQPAFAKVVKAGYSKIPYDMGKDAIDGYTGGYLYYLVTSKEAYLAAVSYGACLWSMNEAGGHLYKVAASAAGGRAIAGPRTLAASKLLAETFKPKFADRSLRFIRSSEWGEGPKLSAAGNYDKDIVNAEGAVGTMKADGDMTKIVFKGETYEGCLQYGNDVNKTCLKKGKMYDSVGEGLAFTKFLTGVKPDLHLSIKFGFPEVVWNAKTKKLTTILTIPVP